MFFLACAPFAASAYFYYSGTYYKNNTREDEYYGYNIFTLNNFNQGDLMIEKYLLWTNLAFSVILLVSLFIILMSYNLYNHKKRYYENVISNNTLKIYNIPINKN